MLSNPERMHRDVRGFLTRKHAPKCCDPQDCYAGSREFNTVPAESEAVDYTHRPMALSKETLAKKFSPWACPSPRVTRSQVHKNGQAGLVARGRLLNMRFARMEGPGAMR